MTTASLKSTIDDLHTRLDQVQTCCDRVRADMLTNPEAARNWAAQMKVEANAIWLVIPSLRKPQ